MKVLFLCEYNIARSQMAQAFFNRIVKKEKAKSAGTNPEFDGKAINSVNPNAILSMKEIGYDLSKKKSKVLTGKLVDWADKVVVFNCKGDFPSYLLKSGKIDFHCVTDPANKDLEVYRMTREEIQRIVEDFVEIHRVELKKGKQI